MNFPREEILKKVKENLSDKDVQAYLNKDDPRHKTIVDEVTKLVEASLGESHPAMGLTEISEREIRQELYDDNRTVEQQIKDILNGHDEKWSKAYFDCNHALHREAVQRVSILAEAKFDSAPHAPEIMPIITRTGGGNMQQGDVIDHGFQNSEGGE